MIGFASHSMSWPSGSDGTRNQHPQPAHRSDPPTQQRHCEQQNPSAEGRWLARLDASWFEQRYGSPVVLVARPVLLALLAELLPVADLRLRSTLGSARCARSRAVACGQGPTGTFEIETDLVVAADGVHSALRPLVDPRASARYAGHTAWRALIPAGLAPPVAGPQRHLGLRPALRICADERRRRVLVRVRAGHGGRRHDQQRASGPG
jgi:2-polyprenyl-6-methoxyphenol hydroxylase-like FAD-dependent oxidoreductase